MNEEQIKAVLRQHEEEIGGLFKVTQEQKGELIALNCLLISLCRGLPFPFLAGALTELETEREVARTVLLNTAVPEVLLTSFDSALARFDDQLKPR